MIDPGPPSGTLQISIDGNVVATAGISPAQDYVQLTVSDLSIGTHSLSAVFTGDGYWLDSSVATSVTITKIPSQTTVTTSPNPSVYGQSFTLSATVTALPGYAPAGGTPTGDVTFAGFGTATLFNGMATLNVTSPAIIEGLNVGPHEIKATYGGNAFYEATSGPGSAGFTVHQVDPAPTETSLTVAPNPADPVDSVLLTAEVRVLPPGGGTPTGTVSFFDTTTGLPLGSAPANGSNGVTTAQISTTDFALSAQAFYFGNFNYVPSDDTLIVNPLGSISGVKLLAECTVDLVDLVFSHRVGRAATNRMPYFVHHSILLVRSYAYARCDGPFSIPFPM